MSGKLYKMDIEWFLKLFDNHFCFARYNDGEWFCMRNLSGKNCDNHSFFPEMGKKIKDSITDKEVNNFNYIFQSSMYWGGEKEDIKKWGVCVDFVERDYIHVISRKYPDIFINLMNKLNKRKLLLVGPFWLEDSEFIDLDFHIVIPKKNCFLYQDKITEKIREILKENDNVTVIFCSSMMTNCIIYDLYKEVDKKHTLIDFGSVFDLFIENKNIKYRLDKKDRKKILEKYKNINIKNNVKVTTKILIN